MHGPGTIAIHWFRRDLRLADNPALTEAARSDLVIPVFIDDAGNPDDMAIGAAGRVWLGRSLRSLDRSLGGNLAVIPGAAAAVLARLARAHGAATVTWNSLPEPDAARRDERIRAELERMGIEVRIAHSSRLWEPSALRRADGGAYQVFTPFYRRGCLGAPPPRRPLPAPALALHPAGPGSQGAGHDATAAHTWTARMMGFWQVGEAAAASRLRDFLRDQLTGYAANRDIPALAATSALSPHLRFGEISAHQVWDAVRSRRDGDADKFRAELGWREFCLHLLHEHPDLENRPLRPADAPAHWREDPVGLTAWQQGRTGIPFVDAGMRQLWQTGWMHNRLRMVTASFLVKNLLIDWRLGALWFRDCLIDADLASNSAGWQWVAGCGADAAPYFRIFNPVLQGRRFDPAGDYVRRFVPELASLPDRWIQTPWLAPQAVLDAVGVQLGRDYPAPIVDIASSRNRALAAFRARAHGQHDQQSEPFDRSMSQ